MVSNRPDRSGMRVLGYVLAPVVGLYDGLRNLMLTMFGVLERLDPLAAVARLFRPIVPTFKRLWQAVLPTLMAIRQFFVSVRRRIAAFIAPVTRPLVAVLERITSIVLRPFAAIVRWVKSAAEVVRETTEPLLSAAARIWRRMTAPFRRLSAAVRTRWRSLVASTRRILGREALESGDDEL